MTDPHLLLLIATTGYTGDAFREAARRAGVPTLVGSNRCHVLAAKWPGSDLVTVDFRRPKKAVRQIVATAATCPIAAIVPTGEATTRIAALASAALGLPYDPPEAAATAGNKRLMREALERAGVPAPRARTFPIDADAAALAREVPFPCVLKPLLLAGSRGVIRADDPPTFEAAFARIGRLLRTPELAAMDPLDAGRILVEPFVPGREVALEALLRDGTLEPLALFDKPDPLDGPFFEETIYVTPSRLPNEVQREIVARTAEAARAIGLSRGPVHAELRVGDDGPQVIEVAARSIGGLCSRTLRFGTGTTLEEIIVRHAMRLPIASLERALSASGVMMIPIPRAGVLERVSGVEEAKRVPCIEDVVIETVSQRLVPLPEGSVYLGFIFARARTPDEVEEALRRAHAELRFDIVPDLAVVR